MMMMYPQTGKLKNMYEVDDDGAKAIMNSRMKCALEQSVESDRATWPRILKTRVGMF